jgi:hypothetical protein
MVTESEVRIFDKILYFMELVSNKFKTSCRGKSAKFNYTRVGNV